MAYDKAQPAPGIKAKELDNLIRTNNDSIQPAIDNEHEFTNASASQSGDHTQGSARCFYTDTAPPTRIDGGLFKTTDLGSLWIDTDDNAIYELTAITPTWTPISTEVIATLLAANRTFLGTLDVTGVLTALASAVVTTSLTVGTTLDVTGVTELIGVATIADNSVTKTTAVATAAAEIANLATVDAQIAALILPSSLSGGNDSKGETAVGEFQIKWGSKAISGTSGTITFITEGLSDFDNSCFQVFVVGGKSTGGTTQTIQSNTPTASNFKWHSGSGADLSPVRWFAIGR